MENRPPVNLVYVASAAFSGSTLFESILGAHSQIETCGEVHLWPHELLQGGVKPTGSGAYVQESPFWQAMNERVRPLEQPAPRIHYFRERHRAGHTLRLERLRDFGPAPLPPSVQRLVRQYGKNNDELFRAFSDLAAETTGRRPRWIVDASKDPYRLVWLVRSGFFRVTVLHLVRDPRAFAYSATRRHVADGDLLRGVKRLYFAARRSLAWVVQNHLFSQIGTHHLPQGNYLLVNYEALASAPRVVFEQVCETIGCPYETQAVDNFRTGSPFAMAGNPMRHETRDIALDERWKKQFPSSSRRIARIVSSINRARYGY